MMTRTRAFTLLPMDLPSARISVDFTNFTPSQPLVNVTPSQPPFPFLDFQFRDDIVASQPPVNVSTLQHSNQSPRSESNKPPHHRNFSRRTAVDNSPLPEISEDRPTTHGGSARAHPRRRWAITRSMPNQPNPQISHLSWVTSNVSAASSVSSNDSFVFSRTQSTASSAYTSYSSQHSLQNIPEWSSPKREPTNLTSLPSHLIEQIVFEALYLPSRVSIGPPSSKDQHQRAGVDCIDLQFTRGQPIFSVSRQIRDVALHVFHDRCDFVIDLHSIYHTRTSSKVRDNLKKHRNFWLDQGPPEIVKDTLCTFSKLSLRLPAASYSSDGQGASLKKESEDTTKIERILEAIASFIWPNADDTRDMGRRSSNEGRNESLRKKSFSHIRSKSREFLYRDSESLRPASREHPGSSMGGKNNGRALLKSFEVVLVKRNPNVTMMPETLNYIKLLRKAQVSGFTDYFLQLEEQKVLFATKYGKKWQGIEPDPDRLLGDLQALSVAPVTPTEFFFSPVEHEFNRSIKTSQLPRLDTGVPQTFLLVSPIQSPTRHTPSPSSLGKLRNPFLWGKKKPKRKDSFTLLEESGEEMLPNGSSKGPPSVEELKRIAEDVRNGLY